MVLSLQLCHTKLSPSTGDRGKGRRARSYGKTLPVLSGMEPPDKNEDTDMEESRDVRFRR